MLSQTVEYALRAAVLLASDPKSPWTGQQVADRTHVPRGYLVKILQQLGRAGLVHAQRGPRGGFTLARDPESLSILEVVNAVEPIQRITECPLGLEAHKEQLCPLHSRLDAAYASIEEAFGRTMLAEVLGEPGGNQPLCELTVEGKKP